MKKLLTILAFIPIIAFGQTRPIVMGDDAKPGIYKNSGITINTNTQVTTLPGGLTVPSGTVTLPSSSVQPAAVSGITSSAGAGDSGKLPKLNGSGKLDSTFLSFSALPTFEVFTSSASWTNSYSVSTIYVECWGGGGSGAAGSGGSLGATAGGGGGGGGSYCAGTMSVTNGQIIAFTVAGTSGSSTFSNGTITFTANGGTGGSGTTAGSGGTATGGTLNISGTAGTAGMGNASGHGYPGSGGWGAFGGQFGNGGHGGAQDWNSGATSQAGQTGGQGAIKLTH